MQTPDAIIKCTEPLRVAEAVATAPGVGTENIGPLLVPLSDEVFAHLQSAGVKPGISIAHYEKQANDGTIRIHVGFEVGTQELPDSDRVRVVELPVVEVASVIHRGPMEGLADAFLALIRWTTQSGHERSGPSRELYHHWDYEDPARHVTELQVVLTAHAGRD
jgi:effector-binding domain-containing protein